MRTPPPLFRLLALALAPHRRSARKRAIAAFGLALAFVPTARAATYTFTKIADNSGELREFGLPSINTDGVVVFYAGLDRGRQVIYTGTGDGMLTTIADTSLGI